MSKYWQLLYGQSPFFWYSSTGKPAHFNFNTDIADQTTNEVELWYQGSDQFIFEIENTLEDKSYRCDIDQKRKMIIDGRVIGRIYHRSNEPNTGLNHVNVFLYSDAPSGEWSVRLYGKKVRDGRYHAWIERDGACRNCQSRFAKQYVDSSYTTGTICNGFHTIAVGAYDPHSPSFKFAPFSSKGPTADGRVKPDLVAPGMRITAARSTPRFMQTGTRLLTKMSGTSMAAPHVTGAAALILEGIKKPVSIHHIRNILLGSTTPIEVNPVDQLRVGSGILNIKRALMNVEKYNHTLGKTLSKHY